MTKMINTYTNQENQIKNLQARVHFLESYKESHTAELMRLQDKIAGLVLLMYVVAWVLLLTTGYKALTYIMGA